MGPPSVASLEGLTLDSVDMFDRPKHCVVDGLDKVRDHFPCGSAGSDL